MGEIDPVVTTTALDLLQHLTSSYYHSIANPHSEYDFITLFSLLDDFFNKHDIYFFSLFSLIVIILYFIF